MSPFENIHEPDKLLQAQLSILDDMRQVLVDNNERQAKIIEQNEKLFSQLNTIISIFNHLKDKEIDDIRQEMVDNKEQTAHVADYTSKLLSVSQDMLSALNNLKS